MFCLHWQRPIKMARIELFGGVHTAQGQRPMQISILSVFALGTLHVCCASKTSRQIDKFNAATHYLVCSLTCFRILSVGNAVLCFWTKEFEAEFICWSGKWLIGHTRGCSSSKASWPWTSRISSLGNAVRSTMWSSKWLFLKKLINIRI